MTEQEQKLETSKVRVFMAIRKIFKLIPDFSGQLDLEVHCKGGIVKDVYEVKRRRKV
jgi:hypothetical protein